MKSTFTRYKDGRISAYTLSDGLATSLGPLEPAATFVVQPESSARIDKILTADAAPELDRAVYATRNSVACIGRNGDLLWRYDLEPRSNEEFWHQPDCAFSLDGANVWVYRPDAMAGRAKDDTWVVLSSDVGKVVAEFSLSGTAGHVGQHILHPDGRHVLLDVGEGQDGSTLFRGTVAGKLECFPYDFSDRVLIDVAPDGRHFMAVDHGQRNVSFHRFPRGEEVSRLNLEALGYDDEAEEEEVDFTGGFLTLDVAVVVAKNDAMQWNHYHRVDWRAGRILGRFDSHSETGYIKPLGDGTWLASDLDGTFSRWQSDVE
ncbi:hypothetical protein LIA77_06563 [Sarocladium implicatum]|nr:hypothetical protein LIA77_06563 [Sarocladium implicatum]